MGSLVNQVLAEQYQPSLAICAHRNHEIVRGAALLYGHHRASGEFDRLTGCALIIEHTLACSSYEEEANPWSQHKQPQKAREGDTKHGQHSSNAGWKGTWQTHRSGRQTDSRVLSVVSNFFIDLMFVAVNVHRS